MNDKDAPEGAKVTLSAVARGYVQGVGFRVFIRSHAWTLGLRGYVENLPDGTVKVLATGPRPKLERLLREIWEGPAGAHVMAVDVDWREGEAPNLARRFEVRH